MPEPLEKAGGDLATRIDEQGSKAEDSKAEDSKPHHHRDDEGHDMSTLISQVQRVPSTARTAGVLVASAALTVAVMAGLNSIVGTWA